MLNFKQLPDKAPKICAFALSFILIVNILFCSFSCAFSPLKASAIDPFNIKETLLHYSNAFKNNMQVVLSAFQHDVNSGTIDGTSSIGKQILQQVMLQYLNQMTVDGVFPAGSDYWEIDWENIPNTIDFSGSGVSGFYRSTIDNNIHIVTLGEEFHSVVSQNLTANMVFSDEFNVDFNFRAVDDSLGAMSIYADYSPMNGPGMSVYLTHTPRETYRFYKSGTDSFNLCTFSNSGQVTVTLNSNNSYSHNTGFGISNSSTIPTFNYRISLSSNSTRQMIGACGIDYTLPDGSAPSISPWDYYNNTLLPQLIQFFNDNHIENYDRYLVFPGGYYPDSAPPSQQYPTGGGISIGNQYNFDIDINFPTYPNGEPQTDESGETITETVIVTDTRPTDAVYQFTVPTLPGLQIDSSPIPFNTNISEYTNPLLGFFDLITEIFDASGVLPVIPILFTMGIIFFVIYKCS